LALCDSDTPKAVVEPTISPTDLLQNVRLLMKAKSTKVILENVSRASSCLSGVSTIQGALGDERKANTLLGRWIIRKKQVGKDEKSSSEGTNIERDTVILVNVKTGRGASASTVTRRFRVLAIYEKFYNRWAISKQPFKQWHNEPKKYKVDARMVNWDSLVLEYVDVDLLGNTIYREGDIFKTVEDSMIVDVVGKLQKE